jgi:hypothetical protein
MKANKYVILVPQAILSFAASYPHVEDHFQISAPHRIRVSASMVLPLLRFPQGLLKEYLVVRSAHTICATLTPCPIAILRTQIRLTLHLQNHRPLSPPSIDPLYPLESLPHPSSNVDQSRQQRE